MFWLARKARRQLQSWKPEVYHNCAVQRRLRRRLGAHAADMVHLWPQVVQSQLCSRLATPLPPSLVEVLLYVSRWLTRARPILHAHLPERLEEIWLSRRFSLQGCAVHFLYKTRLVRIRSPSVFFSCLAMWLNFFAAARLFWLSVFGQKAFLSSQHLIHTKYTDVYICCVLVVNEVL